MRRARVILGFTEAELGFVLAVLFVAVAGHQTNRAAQASADLAAAERSLDSLSAVVAELRGRTSRLDPYCHERGEPNIVVGTVTVLGGGRFSVGARQLDYSGVLGALDEWVVIARRKNCRFAIDVPPGEGLSPNEYLSARSPLGRRYFYFTR